jgi:RNA polymerase sigma-70 factor (ECF subfamily)
MEDRSSTDRALVERAVAGDARAFEDLVKAYQRMVSGVAWRYGIRQADLEDVVSEVFVKLYRNLHRFRPDHPFSTWLYRLSANHAVDHIRRRRKERGRTEMPAQVADPAVGAGASLESDERARLLRDALVDLSVPYREAIELVYVEGLRVDDAAARLGIPSGTVKTRLMRGREALRRILARRHPEHFGDTDAL